MFFSILQFPCFQKTQWSGLTVRKPSGVSSSYSPFLLCIEKYEPLRTIVFLKAPSKILEDVNIRNWKDNWKVSYYIINKEINIYLI